MRLPFLLYAAAAYATAVLAVAAGWALPDV